MLAANKPKKVLALSFRLSIACPSPAPVNALGTYLLALGEGGGRTGHKLSAAPLSGTAQLEAQAHCLAISFQATSINILFSP